eukprot:4254511-Heterocapsa_arctica.AAC.1
MEGWPDYAGTDSEARQDGRNSDNTEVDYRVSVHRVFAESDGLEAATRYTPEVLRQQEPPMTQDGEQME